MDEGLKKRLIGATVLVSLVVIFVPMLLQHEPVIEQGIEQTNIPPQPTKEFTSGLLPPETERLVLPIEQITPLQRTRPPKASTPDKPVVAPKPDKTPEIAQKPSTTPKKTEIKAGLSAWVIQVGSFSHRRNADNLVKTLREKKFSAFMESVDLKGKRLYRVRVGPEVDRGQAEAMLVQLNRVIKPFKLKGTLTTYP
ncbi:MAG: hypothetical protein GY703_26070 [Gammaproteobacteria bacterium]|nr:hypothetical protein [Gammaproteobacteria bacterium]